MPFGEPGCSASRARSDAAAARILANTLRIDSKAHRPPAAESELGGAVVVPAHAHQDTARVRVSRLRSRRLEYYAAALPTFRGSGKLGRIPHGHGYRRDRR
ncbi:hypothetical protein ACZ91_53110 [Streptomyces regensis]|nr:hypothetical protein ACZ91_53110 [Streptomyces regensis]